MSLFKLSSIIFDNTDVEPHLYSSLESTAISINRRDLVSSLFMFERLDDLHYAVGDYIFDFIYSNNMHEWDTMHAPMGYLMNDISERYIRRPESSVPLLFGLFDHLYLIYGGSFDCVTSIRNLHSDIDTNSTVSVKMNRSMWDIVDQLEKNIRTYHTALNSATSVAMYIRESLLTIHRNISRVLTALETSLKFIEVKHNYTKAVGLCRVLLLLLETIKRRT